MRLKQPRHDRHGKGFARQALFPRLGSGFPSALTGQRVDSIFALAALAVEQHRRRVNASVVNEVLKEV